MIRFFMYLVKIGLWQNLSPEEKGLISHRGDALAKLRVKLPQLLQKVGSKK